MFYDRKDAAEQLAKALVEYKGEEETIVIAIPRGGIVIGYALAEELHLPLDVALVKKMGHPASPEYAVGAVSLKGYVVDRNVSLSQHYIDRQVSEIQSLLRKRYKYYYGDRRPLHLAGKTVIVVDDGIATGNTLMLTLSLIRKQEPKQILVAVPVGSADAVKEISGHAEKVVCLEVPDPFYAVGKYYRDFGQVSDEEVRKLLKQSETTSKCTHTK